MESERYLELIKFVMACNSVDTLKACYKSLKAKISELYALKDLMEIKVKSLGGTLDEKT